MSGRFQRAFLLSLTLCACRARAGEPPWRQAAGSLSSTAIRAHVEYLTDDLLEGRRAGSRGEALAARYIAAQLEADGLPVETQRTPLAVATVQAATLEATRGNVTVQLKYGDDFLLLAAPRQSSIEAIDPPLERPSADEWLTLGPARAAAGLVPVGPATRVAIAPAAATQVGGARVVVRATLDLAEVAAATVTARARGADKCERTLSAHHDGFGRGFPGAADGAAGVAILLEVARGLAHAGKPPNRCTVVFRSSGGAEWGAGEHPAPPLPAELAARAHTSRDRISQTWDWEDLKRRAQDALEGIAK